MNWLNILTAVSMVSGIALNGLGLSTDFALCSLALCGLAHYGRFFERR